MLIGATMIGALMPARTGAPATAPADDGVIYTPQSSGSSYRIAGGSGGSTGSGTMTSTDGSGSLRLAREDDGHFYVDAQVNGMPVHFLVDTGASGVALSRSDAQSVGLSLGRGDAKVGEGASGAVMGQWVMLDRIELGGRWVTGTPAVVMEGGNQSLLGQNVLRNFSIDIRGDEMVLR